MRIPPPRTLVLLAILPIVAIALWPVGTWSTIRTVGICLAVPGFGLWFLARVQLGDSFSIGAEARSLVTTGLYRRIRSPIYIFGSLAIAGLILFADRPLLLLAFVVIVPLQILRARAEARVLEQRFGDDYRRYRSTTWLW